jgi:hypothetical protein
MSGEGERESFGTAAATAAAAAAAPACHKRGFDLFVRIWNWLRREIELQYCGRLSL